MEGVLLSLIAGMVMYVWFSADHEMFVPGVFGYFHTRFSSHHHKRIATLVLTGCTDKVALLAQDDFPPVHRCDAYQGCGEGVI